MKGLLYMLRYEINSENINENGEHKCMKHKARNGVLDNPPPLRPYTYGCPTATLHTREMIYAGPVAWSSQSVQCDIVSSQAI